MWPESYSVGWDVGGAHLKMAWVDDAGRVRDVAQFTTPLWRGLDCLRAAMGRAVERLPPAGGRHGITMTGELVDLFGSRREGVAALAALMGGALSSPPLRFYAGPRGFVAAEAAVSLHPWVASANWHATAALAAECLEAGLLVDVGSTTADVVPFAAGRVTARGYSDGERLALEELLYTGVSRTPLMALGEAVPFKGEWVGVVAEQFAHTADVYRLLGRLPALADVDDTADGRGRTRDETMARIARMVGMDVGEAPPQAWHGLAAYFAGRQLDRLQRACARHLSAGLPAHAPLVGAGVGRFLVRDLAALLDRPFVDIAELMEHTGAGAEAADCASAVAVAMLMAREPVACPA
ncbi:MAG: hydantoinase/oxoprolinase family protein [Gammaproteobacteria bacterium]|nr:hydantoinase/oxoprolinase family protein [Gammaproteobacteria bacterium]